jgi:hypothetical protein
LPTACSALFFLFNWRVQSILHIRTLPKINLSREFAAGVRPVAVGKFEGIDCQDELRDVYAAGH